MHFQFIYLFPKSGVKNSVLTGFLVGLPQYLTKIQNPYKRGEAIFFPASLPSFSYNYSCVLQFHCIESGSGAVFGIFAQSNGLI